MRPFSRLLGQLVGHLGGRRLAVVFLALAVACNRSTGTRDVGIAGNHVHCLGLVPLPVPRLRGGAEEEEMKVGKQDWGFIRGGARNFEVEIKRFIPGEPLDSEPSRPRIPPSPPSLLRGDPQEIARWERRRRKLGMGTAKVARTPGKGRIFSHYHEIDRILCRRLRFSGLETREETGVEESVGTEGRQGEASAEYGDNGISTNHRRSDAEHGGDQGSFRSGGQRRRERMLDLAERAMAAVSFARSRWAIFRQPSILQSRSFPRLLPFSLLLYCCKFFPLVQSGRLFLLGPTFLRRDPSPHSHPPHLSKFGM